MNRCLLYIVRKTSALVLAFVIFITSTGFEISTHYCSGHLKSLRFFGKANPCQHITQATPKPCHKHMQMLKKTEGHCCDFKDIKIDQKNYETVFLAKNIAIHVSDFTAPESRVYASFNTFQEYSYFNTLYKPPPIDRDIPVLVQSFLL